MTTFNSVKDWFNQQKTSISEGIARFKNKDFMEAVVAGCAFVACSDGQVKPEEKRKMAGYIERSEELRVFDMKDVIKSFNNYVEGFDFDYLIGKAEVMKSIGRLKGKDEMGRLLIRVCCAIGMADGDFDDHEKQAVREICQELNLSPQEFGL
ncbi:tellurite resistance TerB family protein [Thioflexithrix psekupsensis]|uniref:Tellurite resistance TerB n=1 Tax=Thioflexithrix psekupsensis TaxID=1570016 RepID=A0A251X933_9GAMM|nr:tellurite resistance TerB family protein [Thioflexithrix psekupsensis]OUD14183.1 Tellurite resistance TerB [Thioflexithrix psekupsensis]